MTPRNNYSFAQYQAFYMSIWSKCMVAGYSSADARTFAQMEWEDYVVKSGQ